MSDRGFEFRKRESRGNPTHRNPGLAEAIAKIRAESTTPPPLPYEGVKPPALPRKNIEKGITDADRKRAEDSWHQEALLARWRGQGVLDAKYSPPSLPVMPPPLRGAEERIESEMTGFEQTKEDLNATFKKKFIPVLTEKDRTANEAARMAARKFAAERKVEPVEPKSDMIKRLDAWIHNQKKEVGHRKLMQRLAENFPAMKQNMEISGFADASARALEQLGEELVRESRQRGLEPRQRYTSAWIRERYDAMNKARITRFMIPFSAGIVRTLNSPKMRYAPLAAVFLGALAGVNSALYENADALAQLQASADSLPAFAPDSFHSVSMSDVSLPESIPDAASGTPQAPIMLNGESHSQGTEIPAYAPESTADDVPDMEEHAETLVAEPIEVQGEVSVWSSLLDGLGEKGIDLTERGEEAFAHAVQRAIEDTDTQNVFIEHNGTGLSGVAWDKIPDGANIHFDLLFGNVEFLDRLKEILSSSEYRTLGKELQSMGGVEGFISDVQDAFGVQYL